MNALTLAIEAYAAHAMMSTADVRAAIAAGDARTCKTVSILRLRFEVAA